MITAKVRRAVQRADKPGQVPGKPRDVITAPASILNPPVIGHDRSLSPRSQRVPAAMPTWRSNGHSHQQPAPQSVSPDLGPQLNVRLVIRI